MKSLIQRIQTETPEHFDYEWLGRFVRSIDIDSLDYKNELPEITDPKDYARNILCLEPFECVLLFWPPGVESAVHYHKGFWGYVLCLEGSIDNIEYRHENGKLLEGKAIRANRGGVLNEPDGTIHKIVNASKEDYLVTLHFYYPALDTLDGLELFCLETGRIGVLNKKASTASFNQDEDCFHKITENGFEYVPMTENPNAKSHRIYPIVPKPSSETISKLLGAYYREQAFSYDSFDLKHNSRRRYTEKINQLIADRLKQESIQGPLLDLACGTGRRALDIKKLSGLDYELLGVDLSPEMCSVAQARGVNAKAGNWLDIDMPENYLDAITFLYAYGHIPTQAERKEALKKVYDSLKPGGFLFFDVFNLNDRNEWGPQALKAYHDNDLSEFGYEKGDVFYKKVGGNEVAFLHYCEEDPLIKFLQGIGFNIVSIEHIGYVKRSGEILKQKDEGALFIVAQKS